jgi:hypothetical protein
MRKLMLLGLVAAAGLLPLQAATLQQLSLDQMIQQSTGIVRGKVQLSGSAFRGSLIYTHYQVQVSETLKGTPATSLDVAVLGGMTNGVRQNFAGAPALTSGQEYILFLWTSKTGLTQIIGLSQGLFATMSNSAGQAMVVRAASTERMLNTAGQPVVDSDIQMLLSDFRTRVQTVLATRGGR